MYPQLSNIFKSSKDLVVIGSVGELHHIKGLNYALEAISSLNYNFIYIIVGTGEEKDRLEKQIKDLNLESRVYMLGFLENAYQYFRAFDIFLLPSLSEGLPYIALESGLSSLPTIATAVGGISEVIDDMKSGILIQPRKPSEIKYGIEFYLKHKKTRKEHGLALHDKVVNEFSIDKMVNETEKIYSNSL
jgi:glycosyltransferase involved in cell wall biosynthesis